MKARDLREYAGSLDHWPLNARDLQSSSPRSIHLRSKFLQMCAAFPAHGVIRILIRSNYKFPWPQRESSTSIFPNSGDAAALAQIPTMWPGATNRFAAMPITWKQRVFVVD